MGAAVLRSALDGTIPAVGPLGALGVNHFVIRRDQCVDFVRAVNHLLGDLRRELDGLVDWTVALRTGEQRLRLRRHDVLQELLPELGLRRTFDHATGDQDDGQVPFVL